MILFYLILLVVSVYFIFFVSQFINIVFRGYAPFVSTDKETIERIINETLINEQSTIYELGCGQARFLSIIEKIFPRTKLIGIENSFILCLIAQIKLKLQRSKIKVFKNNFFKTDLKNVDLVYCYLNNMTMERLGEKFKRECKSGTRIISRSFPIPLFEPEKIINIKDKKIYFYIM